MAFPIFSGFVNNRRVSLDVKAKKSSIYAKLLGAAFTLRSDGNKVEHMMIIIALDDLLRCARSLATIDAPHDKRHGGPLSFTVIIALIN